MLAVGIPMGAWLSGSWFAAMVSVDFTIIGLAVGGLIIQRAIGPTLRKAPAQRGQAYEQALTFRLTDDTLAYDLDDVTMAARWACVTDLYRAPKHWVFLVQSSAMVLPRRFFATAEAERAFIAEALSRMTEPARARSPDATKFVGG